MRISDWSSDVCSSDLTGRPVPLPFREPFCSPPDPVHIIADFCGLERDAESRPQLHPRFMRLPIRSSTTPGSARVEVSPRDRKSVVQGTGGSVRVVSGGSRYIKTNNKMINEYKA